MNEHAQAGVNIAQQLAALAFSLARSMHEIAEHSSEAHTVRIAAAALAMASTELADIEAVAEKLGRLARNA